MVLVMELSPRDELWLIRRELDRLSAERLHHFLDPDEEETYELLAARELVLIELLADPLELDGEVEAEFDAEFDGELAGERDEALDLTDGSAESLADSGDTAC